LIQEISKRKKHFPWW